MDVVAAEHQAAEAAALALREHIVRLGVHGVNFDQLIAEATRAAVAVLAELHAGECRAATQQLIARHTRMLMAATFDRDAAIAELAHHRTRTAELGEHLELERAAQAMLTRQVLALRASLTAIERLPYQGDEPMARRIAREGLARA